MAHTLSYIISGVLIIFSGIFSGLTIGLFSLNLSSLQRKARLGNKHAARVAKIRKRGNLLLCTLLLGNVAVNSALAIILESIAGGIIAGFVSTGLIVLFGEILPQAVFSRFALYVASYMSWLVRAFMIILFPIAFPLSWLLDKVLGQELATILTKREIQEIIREHEDSPFSKIDSDEERIILGALTFSDKTVDDIMTPKTVTYMLNEKQIIDEVLIDEIREKGFTRIPVYSKHEDNIIGLLYVKKLIGLHFKNDTTVSQFIGKNDLLFIKRTMRLDNLLNIFIKQHVHMSFIFDEYGIFLGIVTLEDIIEEILDVEIIDEGDKYMDMREVARRKFERKLMD